MNELWRPCPICGVTDERTVLDGGRFQFFSDGPHKQMWQRDVQCGSCYAIYKNPCYSAEGMFRLFAEAGRSYGNALQAQDQAEWVATWLPASSIVLDIGCGTGKFLRSIPGTVARLGIEIDAKAAMVAEDAGVTIITRVQALDQRPDLVTLWHTLEHLADPKSLLTDIRAAVHKGSILIIEVPILEKGNTSDITGFISPQHMTHFSRRSLTSLLNRTGWEIIRTHSMRHNGYRVVAIPSKVTVPDMLLVDVDDHYQLMAHMSHRYGRIAQVESRLQMIRRPGCIWGAGMHIESLYQWTTLFKRLPVDQWLIVDGDPAKHGTRWRGNTIKSPSALAGIDWTHNHLVISSFGSQNAIFNEAIGYGIPQIKINTIYDSNEAEEVY